TSPTGNRCGSRGLTRSNLKLMHKLKFGYPITIRPSNFYTNDKSAAELFEREDSFVNDSIRTAHQNRQESIIQKYEPLDDPHLRKFFQNPMVLDVVRKTLSREYSPPKDVNRRKLKKKKEIQHNTSMKDETIADDYLRINTKGSSGYAKLNGYDCVPNYSTARRRNSSKLDSSFNHDRQKLIENSFNYEMENTKHQNRHQKDHSSKTINGKYQSVDTSLTSFPTTTSSIINPTNNINMNESKSEKRKRTSGDKEKLHPIATSSPLRQLPKIASLSVKQNQNDTDENENEEINPVRTTISTHEIEQTEDQKQDI
ncbi:unnamed protein product, partial [Didymodactylos carnosus]